MKKLHKLMLVGRPNVGKSTLFNRLCRKKLAIVDDMPGVTRDYKIHTGMIADLPFAVIDTAGWSSVPIDNTATPELLQYVTNENTEKNLKITDIILFIIDGAAGVTPDDKEFADMLRRTVKPVLLLINKSESGGMKSKATHNDAYSLGFGDPIYISAMHGSGTEDLYLALSDLFETTPILEAEWESTEDKDSIRIAIVGRPNAGKSTIFNKLLKNDRSIVSDISGTTKDAIDAYVEFNGRKITLVDTAGMRKKNKIIDSSIESTSLGQSITAIRRSNVTVLVTDATSPFDKQDFTIAHIAINEGKGLIFVINKIDLLEKFEQKEILKKLEENFYDKLDSIENIPVIYMSAIEEKNLDKLNSKILEAFDRTNTTLSTSQLNRWLVNAVTSYQPPLVRKTKRPTKIKYITQKSAKPPTFILFSNTKDIPVSYMRYLQRSLAKKFDIQGIPIRLIIKVSENPYS